MHTLQSKNKLKKNTSGKKVRLFNDLSGWLLILPTVIVLYLMVWRPMVTGTIWSFYSMKGYNPTKFVGLKNYFEVIRDTQFLPTMINTVKYVVCSLIVGFVPPIIIAVMINEMVHFKNGFRVIIYLPAIIPGVAALLMWYYMYYPDATGFLNSLLVKIGLEPYAWLNDGRYTILYITIAMTWSGLPSAMLLYYASVQSISSELYEAAIIDGAGLIRRMRHITFPQMRGIILLNFVRQIINVFQVNEQPMAMTGGGPNNASLSMGFQMYKYGFVNGRAGHALALGVIMFLILIVFTCFYFYLNRKIEADY